MMRQLCRFLTSYIPHESGEPLLDVCMSTAVNQYEAARLQGSSDPQRLLAFSSCLLKEASVLLDYRVTAWGQVWLPDNGEPLLDWLAIRGNTLSTIHTPCARTKSDWQVVGSWVLDKRLIKLIAKAGERR